jgi:hypothetical protein
MQINLAAFDAADLSSDPMPHVIVPGFLSAAAVGEAVRDFPAIDMPGLFPPEELTYGPAFGELIALLEGPELRQAVARKFAVDLDGHPTLLTVRACARPSDGQIHRDSDYKLITLIVYLNEGWASADGRLRLLRSGEDIEDYAVEVPPEAGLLLAFHCTSTAWHGHKPFSGRRRCLMMQYVTDQQVRRRQLARHRLSAKVKKVKHLFGLGKR